MNTVQNFIISRFSHWQYNYFLSIVPNALSLSWALVPSLKKHVLCWKQLSLDPLETQLLLYVFFMISSASKSSPASFAFITQFKAKVKVKMMKVLDRQVFPWVRTATLSSLFPSALNVTSLLSPSQRVIQSSGTWPLLLAILTLARWKRCRKRI